MSDSTVSVSIGTEPYATQIQAGQHAIIADEPGNLGGKDVGPDPYALLLSGLGACKAITARMYADRKGWPLEGVRVGLAHSRPEGRDGPELITVTFAFDGDLTDEQRQRLLEIAEKCPVQKTITGGLRVESSMGA